MIEIESLTKAYDGTVVVDAVSLSVEEGEIAVIVGTSGSGKTTLLRMINRLVEPTSGTVRINGLDTRQTAPYELRRRIGYAIQSNGLFPHRTVGQNIGTVPQLLGWQRSKIDSRVDELLNLFQLEPAEFRNRMPAELSGGQQQRVGVARALAAAPRVLLMDEPFGALDPIIRAKAQDDVLAIQKQFKTTIVLVTHDMEEAIHLGDRIAVMDQGKLLQYAPPEEIIAHPATPFVAELIGIGERPFRLLSLSTVGEICHDGSADGAPVAAEMSLRDAYAECLWSRRATLPVADPSGRVIGMVSLKDLEERAGRPGVTHALGIAVRLVVLALLVAFVVSPQSFAWALVPLTKTGQPPIYTQNSLLDLAISHIEIVAIATIASTIVAVSLAILVTRPTGREFLALSRSLANIGQTFPPVAVLAIAVPLLGFGTEPTLIALFLYGLLPIFENALTGLTTLPPDITEAALGVGMTGPQRLLQVELPLALPVILAGIRLSVVVSVATATIGSTVAAHTLGEVIIAGLTTDNTAWVLQGGLIVAVLAVLVYDALSAIERRLTRRSSRRRVA